MDCTRFGNKLNYYREKNGMTEKELARRLHVPARSVIKWENSEAVPNDRVIQKLSDMFGVDFWNYLDLDEKHEGVHHFDMDDPDYSPLTTQADDKKITKTKSSSVGNQSKAGVFIARFTALLAVLAIFFEDKIAGMTESYDVAYILPFVFIFLSLLGGFFNRKR